MSKKYILLFTIIWLAFQPFENVNAALRTKARICAIKGTVQTGAVVGDGVGAICPLKRTMNQTECRVVNQATMVETGPDGYATVEYADGKKIKIMPNTKVILRRNNIYIESGSSWFKVERDGRGGFVVNTPTAILGIRGTEFVVNVEKDGSTNFQLIEGSVEISDAKKKSSMMLSAGMEVSIAKGSSTLNTALLDIKENNKWWTDWPTLIPIAQMPGNTGGTTSSNTSGNTLSPIADSHVYAYSYSNWNKANWGKYEVLGAGWNSTGGEKRAYLKFDISGIDKSTFEKASLKLFHYHTAGGNSAELGVYTVRNSWNEGNGNYKPANVAAPGEVCWINQPQSDQYPVAYFNPGTQTNDFVEVDITALVKSWLEGMPNHGLAIKAGENYLNGPTSVYGFYSREHEDIDKRPQLIINDGSSSGGIEEPQVGQNTNVIIDAENSRPWVIGQYNGIHYGTGSGWKQQSGGGKGKDITIDGNGRPWVIGTDNGIYYHDDKKWVSYPGGGKGSALAVSSDGTPWVIGAQNRIYYGTGSTWAEQPGGGRGKDIAVDKNGRPWVIGTNNAIFYYEGKWVEYPGGGRGSKLAISPDGSPWVIGNDKDVFYHDGNRWVRQPGGKIIAKDIAVDDQNRPWVLKTDNRIFYHNGNSWIEYPGGGRGLAIAISTINKPNTNSGSNNLLVNGSFEDPAIGWYKTYTVGQNISGWKVVNAAVDVTGTYFKSSDGKQSMDLHGSPGFGGVEQTFATQRNKKYRVVFDFAGNPAGDPKIKRMRITAAGQSKIFEFDCTGKTTTKMGWTTQSWEFKANSNSTTISFSTLSSTGMGNYGPAIDNVSVYLEGGKQNNSKKGNSKISVTGRWLADQSNGFNGTLNLRQTNSGKITGDAIWNGYLKGTIDGQVDGNSIEFTISYPDGIKGLYKGTLTQNGSRMINGTVKGSNGTSANWDASR